MNKQELINELAKYVKRYENVMDDYSQGRYGAYKVSLKLVKRLNEPKITDEQAWNKIAEAYSESVQSLRNTLDNAVFGKADEHQKPVVPKFVAEWFEKHKHQLGYSIWKLVGESHKSYTTNKLDMRHWICQEPNEPFETLIRMKDGYEVEKEPLYYVKLPVVYFNHLDLETYLMKDDRGNITIADNNDFDDMKFTESEIKAIDERYWAFAVPVEEVVER
ncbi:DUF1642 domain-containing protein [Enterococcus faecium]|uniref:DUF1642 domain-containing protein n=1 Tax=Enterococcus faecium TaxID=1352 RepID=UPI0013708363|nr:DUF1642 domain-containing protein [Enterococcus faecium]NAL97739.1 DUF1642 domain-containing protein [Enterococcus faecium]NAM11457.1 DUF1642 domain-containing protein [Enterococcus faecium]NAM26636.1 DUF1642 domain-containing protein [Enterococcus faecium]NAM34690.1 DUF1642 domain-containing protein [Enterococcus faecium]NAM42941.1 DUF1642 domain-containing protein [Enterococcus faecium]